MVKIQLINTLLNITQCSCITFTFNLFLVHKKFFNKKKIYNIQIMGKFLVVLKRY